VLTGILNGADYQQWNPEIDAHIPHRYSVTNWREGKAACKAALQQELGLPVSPAVPLIGMIGRLADQKGWDLIAALLKNWAPREDVQWAILGTGEPSYAELLRQP